VENPLSSEEASELPSLLQISYLSLSTLNKYISSLTLFAGGPADERVITNTGGHDARAVGTSNTT
jgi:hypothetical protein